tara:strand:+ start:170 stop:676 length:507 start_codon:yes stop_codon:yes gene_type:complete
MLILDWIFTNWLVCLMGVALTGSLIALLHRRGQLVEHERRRWSGEVALIAGVNPVCMQDELTWQIDEWPVRCTFSLPGCFAGHQPHVEFRTGTVRIVARPAWEDGCPCWHVATGALGLGDGPLEMLIWDGEVVSTYKVKCRQSNSDVHARRIGIRRAVSEARERIATS